MPVTAKLSSKFYERFGDDIVNWFNAVDLTYQTQLKETNELNWERYKAHLDSRLSELRADLMKWMFLYWVGSVVTLGGLIIGLLRLAP